MDLIIIVFLLLIGGITLVSGLAAFPRLGMEARIPILLATVGAAILFFGIGYLVAILLEGEEK